MLLHDPLSSSQTAARFALKNGALSAFMQLHIGYYHHD